MKKLIVIEGLDGSGKSTQLEMLKKKLPDAHFITFPYYETHSGQIISTYLSGGYPEEDPRVSAYSASVMYAVDRYTSYSSHWCRLYNSGKPVISARYVSSNAVYQMTKLPKEEWEDYLKWLCDLEYNKLAMPRPDLTLFLDVPTAVSQKLLTERYGGDESKKDIHERDVEFLMKCREAAHFTAARFGWDIIECTDRGKLRTPEDINETLMNRIENMIKQG